MALYNYKILTFTVQVTLSREPEGMSRVQVRVYPQPVDRLFIGFVLSIIVHLHRL